MAEPEWGSFELAEVFPDPAHRHVSLATFTVDADSEFARRFLVEPLPYLAKNVESIDQDWTVSLERINADRIMTGPRKILVIVICVKELRTARVLVYRLPQDAD
jgi:hypothetical protein